MLTAADNAALTQVGPGTPLGKFFRRYWIPAAKSEEIREPGEGRIRAMVTIAGNPVLSTPDGAGLAEALEDLDFMVAVDIYLNETTRHADVILPPASALERDQYDLVFHGFAVRNTARFTPAVFAKPDDAWPHGRVTIWAVWSARTCPRFQSGDMSPHSKTGAPLLVLPVILIVIAPAVRKKREEAFQE